MHSKVGVWAEAQAIYIRNSGLAEMKGPVRILDIGLGTGANAVAALECAKATPGLELSITSYENDLDGLRTTLSEIAHFPFLHAYKRELRELLEKRETRIGAHAWRLVEGDYSKLGPLPEAELAFYDFYSPAYAPELWTRDCFEKIRTTSLITTYSAATSVRVAMLESGFFVGIGEGTGAKAEATIAAREQTALKRPLTRDWFLRKSAEIQSKIAHHPQFTSECGN